MLKDWIKAGDTVYTILRHRSASGMSRIIDCKHVDKQGRITHIGYNVARALGYTWDSQREGMRVGGCGMDMGFHVVYSLGSVLWGHGKDSEASKQGVVTGRNGDTQPETDGGYLLKHSWL